MSVPVKNIPIGLKNVVTSFSEGGSLTFSSITLLPGTQPESDPSSFTRNWNFNIAGRIKASNPIASFDITMDLSNVEPTYFIDFEGPLIGTLQVGSKLYPSDKLVALTSDNTSKTITLSVSLKCPRSSFLFNLNGIVADGGSSITACGCPSKNTTLTVNGESYTVSTCSFTSNNGAQVMTTSAVTLNASTSNDCAWTCAYLCECPNVGTTVTATNGVTYTVSSCSVGPGCSNTVSTTTGETLVASSTSCGIWVLQ